MVQLAEQVLDDEPVFPVDDAIEDELTRISMEAESIESLTKPLYTPTVDEFVGTGITLEGHGQDSTQLLCELVSDYSEESKVNTTNFMHSARRFKEFVRWLWEQIKKAAVEIRRKVNELLMKVFDSTAAMRRELDKRRRAIRRLKRQGVRPPREPLSSQGLHYIHLSGQVDLKNLMRTIEKDFPRIDAIKKAYIDHLPEIYQLQTKASQVFTISDKQKLQELKDDLDERFQQKIEKANEDIKKAFEKISGEELPGGRVLRANLDQGRAKQGEEMAQVTIHFFRDDEITTEQMKPVYVEDLDTLEKLVDTVDEATEEIDYWQGPVNKMINHYDESIENIDQVIEQKGFRDLDDEQRALMREQQSYFRSRMSSARSSLLNAVSNLTRYQFQVLRGCDRYLDKAIRAMKPDS